MYMTLSMHDGKNLVAWCFSIKTSYRTALYSAYRKARISTVADPVPFFGSGSADPVLKNRIRIQQRKPILAYPYHI